MMLFILILHLLALLLKLFISKCKLILDMKKIIILLLVVASSGIIKAQNAELSKYKSMFTLNFIRYVGWNDEAKEGDFIIGVLKNSSIAKLMKENVVGKKVGYQTIVIKEFKNIDEITNCNIIYIGESINYSKYANTISQKLNNKNSLIITEDNNAISNGSIINFVIVDNKLKFEVSAENAQKNGLKLSSSLLSLKNAIKV